jgi:hypothetical protein
MKEEEFESKDNEGFMSDDSSLSTSSDDSSYGSPLGMNVRKLGAGIPVWSSPARPRDGASFIPHFDSPAISRAPIATSDREIMPERATASRPIPIPGGGKPNVRRGLHSAFAAAESKAFSDEDKPGNPIFERNCLIDTHDPSNMEKSRYLYKLYKDGKFPYEERVRGTSSNPSPQSSTSLASILASGEGSVPLYASPPPKPKVATSGIGALTQPPRHLGSWASSVTSSSSTAPQTSGVPAKR